MLGNRARVFGRRRSDLENMQVRGHGLGPGRHPASDFARVPAAGAPAHHWRTGRGRRCLLFRPGAAAAIRLLLSRRLGLAAGCGLLRLQGVCWLAGCGAAVHGGVRVIGRVAVCRRRSIAVSPDPARIPSSIRANPSIHVWVNLHPRSKGAAAGLKWRVTRTSTVARLSRGGHSRPCAQNETHRFRSCGNCPASRLEKSIC